MSAHERLRQAIDRQSDRLRRDVPADREAAVLALLRARDRQPLAPAAEPDLLTGRRVADLGGNRALQFCLEASEDVTRPAIDPGDMDRWAEGLLEECAALVACELVLAHHETGFMRLADDGHGTFDAWIATKRVPASWRERADFDWWARSLAARHGDGSAAERLAAMEYQLSYPPDAVLGGHPLALYRNVLRLLIEWALQARERGEEPGVHPERALVKRMAAALGRDPGVIGQVLAAFTVDRESVAEHAAVPGVAAAPLVRIAPDRVAWSVRGLTTEPLLFLTREMRRRDAQGYNNSAVLREGVFRQDLYALFQDKRFITSSGRIELRRDSGNVRTDIDAVVFDRKTGTLAFFELKSQDPFARSTAELARQRDNVLYANRQVSGGLAWLQRHGADELLKRVDTRAARTFRAQRVLPFVLGRYLAHFSDGPEPDRRAVWGTWPQVLRLLDAQPVRASDSNPLLSLFNRLAKDDPSLLPPPDTPSRDIVLGDVRLRVHPSYGAFLER